MMEILGIAILLIYTDFDSELAQAIKAETSELPSLAAKMSENTAEVKHLKSSEDSEPRFNLLQAQIRPDSKSRKYTEDS